MTITPDLAVILFLAGLVVAVFTAAALLVEDRLPVVKVVIWIGLLAPLAIDQPRTRSDILTNGLSTIDFVKGIVPPVCLLIALALHRVRLQPASRLEWLLGLFLAIALLSGFWSIVPFATVLKAGNLITGYILILYLVRLHAKRGESSLDSLATALHLLIATSLVWLIVAPQLAMVNLLYDPTSRLSGYFPAIAPDLLAFCAAAACVLMLGGAGPRWTHRPPVTIAMAIVYLIVILLTRTRTELVVLFAGVLAIWIHYIHKHPVVLLGLGAGLLALLVAFTFAADPITQFLLRGQNQAGLTTLTGRTVLWADAIRLWANQPIGGYGYYAGHRFGIDFGRGAVEFSNLDNIWIETLLDVGVVGTIPLMALVIVGGVSILRSRDGGGLHAPLRRAMFIMGFFAGFINPSLQSNNYAMLVFAFVLFGAPRLLVPSRVSPTALARVKVGSSC